MFIIFLLVVLLVLLVLNGAEVFYVFLECRVNFSQTFYPNLPITHSIHVAYVTTRLQGSNRQNDQLAPTTSRREIRIGPTTALSTSTWATMAVNKHKREPVHGNMQLSMLSQAWRFECLSVVATHAMLVLCQSVREMDKKCKYK